MPVAKFYVSGCADDSAVVKTFLDRASELYARVLKCPKDRVRVFYLPCSANMTSIQGQVPGPPSVFFEFIVLEGRPLDQRQEIARQFCVLIEEVLGIGARTVRGQCIRVEAEDWCIGGQFADDLRKSEIESRKNQLKR